MKRIMGYVSRYRGAFIFTIIFSMTFAIGQVGGVLKAGDFVMETLIGENFEYVNAVTVLILVGFGLMWAASHYFAFWASNTLAASVIHDLRREVFQKLIDMPIPYYKKNQSGEILSRVLNDMSVIEVFLMNIVVHIVAQPLTVIAIIVMMIYMNPKITGYFFMITPLIGLALAGLGSLVQNLSLKVQKNISTITSNLQEAIYGIEVIKGYGVESEIKDKFNQSNATHLKSSKKELRIRLLGTPVTEFLGVVGVMIILVLGAYSVKPGVNIAQPGEIITFLLLALVLSQPLSQVGNIVMVFRKLAPASQRLFEIIDSDEHEDFDKPDITTIRGEVEFKNVGFSYEEGHPILEEINFKIEPGETVAVVGSSGAGKSTFISLIPVFNLCQEGEVMIDGQNVADVNPLSIRRQISLVTQETILFTGTIAENIRLSAKDATDEEVIEAAKIAHAHEFITEMAEGYQSMIGEKGVKLSGGQRQRIVLARAILRKPRILILDEATSSLDAESEKKISKAMEHILGKQTTLIITHKLSTISSADKIMVLDKGKIIEAGSHQQLLDQKGIYNKLYQIQLNV